VRKIPEVGDVIAGHAVSRIREFGQHHAEEQYQGTGEEQQTRRALLLQLREQDPLFVFFLKEIIKTRRQDGFGQTILRYTLIG
jgi:hypothetical protein